MYKVIKMFTDGQDDFFRYEVGDTYPRKGYKPSEDRIKGLLGTNNKQGVPLIEEVKVLSGDKKTTKKKKTKSRLLDD